MSTFKFNKEKYLKLVAEQGPAKTLTELQNDIVRWEIEAFEGPKGYQPEMWKELQEARNLCREIWDMAP